MGWVVAAAQCSRSNLNTAAAVVVFPRFTTTRLKCSNYSQRSSNHHRSRTITITIIITTSLLPPSSMNFAAAPPSREVVEMLAATTACWSRSGMLNFPSLRAATAT